MSKKNEQVVRDLYAAFARGDGAAVLEALHPKVSWNEAENHPYADRNPYVGPTAVAEGLFSRLGSEWIGYEARPQEYISADSKVVVLGRYAATYKANSRPLDAQFAHVWTLSDGKVTAFQQYADTAQFARVTGS